MRKVVDVFVSGRIPDVQRQLMLLTALILDVDHLCVVLHDVRVQLFLPLHRLTGDERVDDRRFAHVRVPHKNHLRCLFRFL